MHDQDIQQRFHLMQKEIEATVSLMREAKIDLTAVDEYDLERLLQKKAPIDGFGIGTHMDTSADAPYLDCAYKLVEYAAQSQSKPQIANKSVLTQTLMP